MYDHDECKKLHSTYVCLCLCVCVIMMLRSEEWHERDKLIVSVQFNALDKCASCLGRTEGLQTCHREKKGGGVCLHNEANEPWLNVQVGNE